jgi:MYXO-CTERM domain-containing protein
MVPYTLTPVPRRSLRQRVRLLVALGLVLVLVALVGCGDERGEPAHAGYDISSTSEALSTKCGANKYHGVQGADVSEFQESVNWTSMRHHGIAFAYARISYGTGHQDPYFSENWRHMKSAGVLRGAYQFFLASQSATAQANLMVKKVGKLGAGDLPCMIDVEVTDGQSASTIASKVKTWLNIVKKGTGKTPIIYTGAYFWQDSVRSTSFRSYPLWIAAYGPSCPSLPNGWGNWKIWQYCDGQTKYCTNGEGFDRDVFNGSRSDLEKLASGDKTLKAKGVRKWSNAKRYHGKAADYLACAGDKLKLSFTFKNIGTAEWRDVSGRGKSVGSDVFLVTASGKKDRITRHKRYSIRLDKNSHVRGDRNAKNCSNKNGCRKTTFIAGAMSGRAPSKPGIYKTRWRLRDYSKHWGKHSHGFGPKVQIKLKVVDCSVPQGTCGCRVWCNNGKSHQLASSITTNAECKSAAKQFCHANDGNSSIFITDFNACPVPLSGSAPPSSGGASDSGGAASGSGGSASGNGGASSSGGSASGSGGAGGTPFSGNGGAAGGQAFAGAGGAAPSFDPGSEDDPNGIDIHQTGDNSKVQDDPGFSDDGFNGDDQAADQAPDSGCSVAAPGEEHGAPLGLGALMVLFGIAEVRRRQRRA